MKTLLVMTLLFSSEVWANAKVIGNGGNSVVCKDSTGKIKTAELLDLYEGRVLKALTYKESHTPHLDQASFIIKDLAKVLKQDSSTDGGVIDLLNRVTKNIILLPSGTGLKPIPDSNEFIIPKGCEVIQTANFFDYERLYIDSDIWGAFSETQKAALLVHETIYWYLRDTGSKRNLIETNSIRARKATAFLFSGKSFVEKEIYTDSIGKKPLFCSTDNALEADRPATFFYIHVNKDHKLVFQFIMLLDRILLTRASLTSEQLVKDLSSWPSSSVNQTWNIASKVDSLIDSDMYVSVSLWPSQPENNKIFVRDSDGNASHESFHCE